jgi:hypothetical protein
MLFGRCVASTNEMRYLKGKEGEEEEVGRGGGNWCITGPYIRGAPHYGTHIYWKALWNVRFLDR